MEQIISFVCFNVQGVPEGWGLCVMTIQTASAWLSVTQKMSKCIFKHFHLIVKTFRTCIVSYSEPHPSGSKQYKPNLEMFANDTHFPILTPCIMLSTLQVVIEVRSQLRAFAQNIYIFEDRII